MTEHQRHRDNRSDADLIPLTRVRSRGRRPLPEGEGVAGIKRLFVLLFIASVLAIYGASPAALVHAHEIRPALLDIHEQRPGWFDVTWKVPMRGDRILAIEPELPSSLEQVGPPVSTGDPWGARPAFDLQEQRRIAGRRAPLYHRAVDL